MNKLSFIVSILLVSFSFQFAEAKNLPDSKILCVKKIKTGEYCLVSVDPSTNKESKLTQSYNFLVGPQYNQVKSIIGFTNMNKDQSSDVYILNTKANKAEKILSNAALLSFSPDGKFFLFVGCGNETGLFLYDIEKASSKKVSTQKTIASANWSSDGKTVVASYLAGDGKTDMVLFSYPDFKAKLLTKSKDADEIFPSFCKGDSQIVFAYVKNKRWQLSYYDVLTKKITQTAIPGSYPSISKDGKWILFSHRKSVFVCDSNGKELPQVITDGKMPVWLE